MIGALCPWCLLITITTTLVFMSMSRVNILDGNFGAGITRALTGIVMVGRRLGVGTDHCCASRSGYLPLPVERSLALSTGISILAHCQRREDRNQNNAPRDRHLNRVLAGNAVPIVGFGLPKSSRHDAVNVLTGFHSAIGCKIAGNDAGGTNTFEMNVSGKIVTKVSCCAVSVLGTDSPIHTPIQAMT